MSDFDDIWPRDGSFYETSRAGIAKTLFEAGRVTIEQVIEFMGHQPLDITKAVEGALVMAGEREMFGHLTRVEVLMLPDGSIGIGCQVCNHFRLDEMTPEQQETWQRALLAGVWAHGFETREHEGQLQIRVPSDHGEPVPDWMSMSTDSIVSNFVEELDAELGASYDPNNKMSRWLRKER